MSDDDDVWRPSGELPLAPPALVALEERLTPEHVCAVAEVGSETVAVLSVDATQDDEALFHLVRVDALDPISWTVISRHEWWREESGCSSAALAALVDAGRDTLPVLERDCDSIRPVITLPCRDGLELFYVTTDGVAVATQLFESPQHLVRNADRWPTFEEAIDCLTMEI